MRSYLLDTSVISALAPDRKEPNTAVIDWLKQNIASLYISTATIAEIEQGVCKLKRIGADARAMRFESWLNALITDSADRIIPIDLEIAKAVGALTDKSISIGRYPGAGDVYIAATSLAKNMELLTRNPRHFAALGIQFSDPFEWTTK
jgi:toxin FitB